MLFSRQPSHLGLSLFREKRQSRRIVEHHGDLHHQRFERTSLRSLHRLFLLLLPSSLPPVPVQTVLLVCISVIAVPTLALRCL